MSNPFRIKNQSPHNTPRTRRRGASRRRGPKVSGSGTGTERPDSGPPTDARSAAPDVRGLVHGRSDSLDARAMAQVRRNSHTSAAFPRCPKICFHFRRPPQRSSGWSSRAGSLFKPVSNHKRIPNLPCTDARTSKNHISVGRRAGAHMKLTMPGPGAYIYLLAAGPGCA